MKPGRGPSGIGDLRTILALTKSFGGCSLGTRGTTHTGAVRPLRSNCREWRQLLRVGLERVQNYETSARKIRRVSQSYLDRFANDQRPVRDETLPKYIRGLKFVYLRNRLEPIVPEFEGIVHDLREFARDRIVDRKRGNVRLVLLEELGMVSFGTLANIVRRRRMKTITVRRVAGAIASMSAADWEYRVDTAG